MTDVNADGCFFTCLLLVVFDGERAVPIVTFAPHAKFRLLSVPIEEGVDGFSDIVVEVNRRVPPSRDAREPDDNGIVLCRMNFPVLVVDFDRLFTLSSCSRVPTMTSGEAVSSASKNG
ncbi:hypothetical protein [Halobellus ordinarius]|uniref:hypothetical protein n=1 Tax=Halobellus ordinarius TaxID=3075120 RepID=UPI0028807462|nr:hypothetical protein [Halobellus sp. ZY16]